MTLKAKRPRAPPTLNGATAFPPSRQNLVTLRSLANHVPGRLPWLPF
jgi:hypothetical protein